ncbi:protein involved in polysaccharide export, contains SLBB domain of the beta-grasp fold [Spirosoma endophyticum]|uniref:Protein involved in polysaccharide export, contains SLBB domain of the beta-grasp fold n=2 Tax=Spirosoma endophyticum TaxID=662367 RepID=A0A1I1THL2_9BACT|nr:protein involved in polysaccharide export, contains SLBB domain of the beta-grasp fold [Spirosoma endophyticum]
MLTKDKLSYSICRNYQFSFILLLFTLIGMNWAAAQQAGSRANLMSDEQVLDFYRQAQSRGLTESQIEIAAMSQGFTQADIAILRRRNAEIQTKGAAQSKDRVTTSSSNARTLPSDVSTRNATDSLPTTTRRDANGGLAVFGASLFANASLSFEPNLRIATPRNYIVGPDDEIGIDISGASSDNLKLKVAPEGTVKIQNLPPIFVSGLTIEQAQARIVDRLRKSGYQGLGVPGSNTFVNVTLANIRSIKVTIVGEVVRPGTYTISSLGSAFNALYLAGGPNPATGSFRKINVIRGNHVVRTIDLYDYILRADQRDNIRLMDQDVIRVADYQTHVELTGQVRRPAIFEMLPGETVKTMLSFAGGFADDAYRASITVRRNTDRERQIKTITEAQMADFVPQSGDTYFVGKILERYENRVQIGGAIMRPGDFAIEPGTETVRQLIQRAEGLRNDAFKNRAMIVRELPNLDKENISFDLGKLMKGEIADIPLMKQDVLTILSIRDLREEYFINVEGAVNEPSAIPFVSNMSIADLVANAGGFREGAKPSLIEVARRIRQDSLDANTPALEIHRFSIDRDLQISAQEIGNDPAKSKVPFALQPFDIVYVRTSPTYEPQQQVYIGGQVMQPGSYAIFRPRERIADLIKRAGGLKPQAYLAAAQFKRDGLNVGTDISKVIENPNTDDNLLLSPNDTLFIPRRPEVVSIQGAVLNPALVSYKASYSFDDYVSDAGGFTENAVEKKTYVIYPNGHKKRTHKFLFFKTWPEIEPGSTVIVPFKPFDVRSRLSTGERISILSLLATLAFALTNVLRN